MKKMNLTGLPAWKPRQPGAALRNRIFAPRPATPEDRSFWNLLVPAAACMVLSLLALNSGNALLPLHHTLMGNLVISNLSYSADASGGAQTVQNHVDSLTFESTNRSGFGSPVGFTSSTN